MYQSLTCQIAEATVPNTLRQSLPGSGRERPVAHDGRALSGFSWG